MALPNEVNVGTAPNNGTGDPLRTGGQKINANFVYLDQNKIGLVEKGANNGVATLDSTGKLTNSQLPQIAITDVIVATENTIAAFAANSGNYTFQQGDVIIINDGSGNLTHYLYVGGVKTDVNEYSPITGSEIEISQVNGLQDALDAKENIANKATDFSTINNTLYPSLLATENRYGQLSALEANDIGDPAKSNVVDVFVIYGQSNAAGGTLITSGDPVQVPTDYGYKWDYANNNGGGIQQLADPTRKDGQQKISAWPAFGKEWARLTGRPSVIVNMAEGGRTVLELSPGEANGYFADMIQATNDTISALTGLGKTINSLQMYWCQGESDIQITDPTTYLTRLDNIWSTFYTEFSARNPQMYISKIWGAVNNTDTTYWKNAEALGYEQVKATGVRDRWACVFDKAPLFTRDNKLISPDDYVHYSQFGYNWMGEESAENIYKSLRGEPVKYEILDNTLRRQVLTTYESNLPSLFEIVQNNLGFPLAKVEDDKITLWNGDVLHKDTGSNKYFSTPKFFPIDPNDGVSFVDPVTPGIAAQNISNPTSGGYPTNTGAVWVFRYTGVNSNRDFDLHKQAGTNNFWVRGYSATNTPNDWTRLVTEDKFDVFLEPDLIDTPRLYTAQQGFDEFALTDAATVNWDLDNQVARLLATSAVGNTRALTISNSNPGVNYQLTYIQDATGGRELDLSNFDSVYGAIDLGVNKSSIINVVVTNTGTSFAVITSDVSVLGGQTLTGTEINLSNVGGNNYNYATPSTATTYTTVTPVINGFARCFINAASEPTVTGATKVSGSLFEASTVMEMVIESPDGTAVEYYFIKR